MSIDCDYAVHDRGRVNYKCITFTGASEVHKKVKLSTSVEKHY